MKVSGLRASAIVGCMVFAFTIVVGAEPRTYQTSNLFQFMMPGVWKAGAATLTRSKQSAELRVAAGDLNMNSSYTIWWVVFNNPSACVDGCNGPDLAIPEVRGAVFYAGGFVTGVGTSGYVAAHLDAGALPAGADAIIDGTASGLEPGNGFGAEIHIVIRTHGITTPGMVDQQIGTFNGGCSPSCANVQAAMFLPVN